MGSFGEVVGGAVKLAIQRRLKLCALLVAAVVGGIFAANAFASHPLTAAAYRAQARGFCTVSKRAIQALPPPPPTSEQTAVVVKDWTATIKIESTELTALERLVPPPSLTALVRKGLAAKAAQIAQFRQAVRAVRAGTPPSKFLFLIFQQAINNSRAWGKVGAAVCQW